MRKDFYLLDAEIRNCKRCGEILAKYPEDPPAVMTIVHPRPVLSEPSCAPIMHLGQMNTELGVRSRAMLAKEFVG
jgi:hypothetical protein